MTEHIQKHLAGAFDLVKLVNGKHTEPYNMTSYRVNTLLENRLSHTHLRYV